MRANHDRVERLRACPARAVGARTSREQTEQLVNEVIAMHLERLADDGLPIPGPESVNIVHVELPDRPDGCCAFTGAKAVEDGSNRRVRCGCEWALADSNRRPQPCEGCALTN